MSHRAAWLQESERSDGLGSGRRWGDQAWALAAMGQAWLMGAWCGRWPEVAWTARWPQGPRPTRWPLRWRDLPDRTWMALLRHGSTGADPDAPRRREGPWARWAWEALGQGDPMPWMALARLMVPDRQASRWVAGLGLVSQEGALHLPPFLEGDVPAAFRRLPVGWWERLAWRVDEGGRLMPDREELSPVELDLVARHARALEPLVLSSLPEGLEAVAVPLEGPSGTCWMVDPALRAWVRGEGFPAVAAWPGWDIGHWQEGPSGVPGAHALCSRWRVPVTEREGAVWDEAGEQAWREGCVPEALDLSVVAHARLTAAGRLAEAHRSAGRVFRAARHLGRLDMARAWIAMGHEPGRRDGRARLDAAWLLADSGEFAQARARLRDLVREGVDPDGCRDLDRHLRRMEDAVPLGDDEVRNPLDLARAAWRGLREGTGDAVGFWRQWHRIDHRPRKLHLALRVMEEAPQARVPEHMVAVQALVDSCGTDALRNRFQALWPPVAAPAGVEDPVQVLEAWLAHRPSPTWIVGAHPGQRLGKGEPPPGLLGRLQATGALPPLALADGVWMGLPLHWEGRRVGGVLWVAGRRGPGPDLMGLQVVAPWVARWEEDRPEGRPVLGRVREPDLLADGSEPMASLLAEAQAVAPTAMTVLLLGATGTGKELLAREIHALSGRRGPLVAVNCSAFAEGILESELFGHLRGAFTGAERDRTGAVEAADGGTLFLDEVADLSPRSQGMLLRVLQEREVRPVGGDRARAVDVRFIAATHRDLEGMAEAGTFRRDLLYRLSGTVLRLPTLAERRHELQALLPALVARAAVGLGLPVPVLGKGLAAFLADHAWPGNFRELGHALERAVLRCKGGVLGPSHFPDLRGGRSRHRGWDEAHQRLRRDLLMEALERGAYRVSQAARSLGLSRPAFYQAARKAGIDLAHERLRRHGEGGRAD